MKDEKPTRRKGDTGTRGRDRHAEDPHGEVVQKLTRNNFFPLNIPVSPFLRVTVSSSSSFILHPSSLK